jgi:lysophospholipid acyltransferase (LPLAT)-like uncharacterized protein
MTPPDLPKRAAVSGVVIPELARWHGRLVARLVWVVVNLMALTLRWKWVDRSGLIDPDGQRRIIFAIWHNRLSLSLVIYRRILGGLGKGRRLAAIVSASKDGGLLAHVLELFHVQGVRGSSSRRGAQALRELVTAAEQGMDLAVTPDGPRGPKYEPHPGVIALAQMTGLPVVPVGVTLGWKWTLKSWDGFQIPLPFSVVEVRFDPPIEVPPDADSAERERLRLHLKDTLLHITRD